jgi:hypothetical protein
LIKSMTEWMGDQERAHKASENELMGLRPFADTLEKREAIDTLLEISKEGRHRASRSIEARIARSDPRIGRDRNDGRDGGRNAGRLPR